MNYFSRLTDIVTCNLAEILDTISHTIRERIRIKGEIKTLTASGRATGTVIGLLPIGLAILLYTIDLDVDMFPPLFAMSRIAGWTAHIMEQFANNRLIRPDVTYIGPMGLQWVPIDQR